MKTKKIYMSLVMFIKGRFFGKNTGPTYTLDELLEGCSRESLAPNEEDHQWLYAKPVGKEII